MCDTEESEEQVTLITCKQKVRFRIYADASARMTLLFLVLNHCEQIPVQQLPS